MSLLRFARDSVQVADEGGDPVASHASKWVPVTGRPQSGHPFATVASRIGPVTGIDRWQSGQVNSYVFVDMVRAPIPQFALSRDRVVTRI